MPRITGKRMSVLKVLIANVLNGKPSSSHIEAVQLESGHIISVNDVIYLIKTGEKFWTTDPSTGQNTYIQVVKAETPYIRTVQNDDGDDNLLSLPNC